VGLNYGFEVVAPRGRVDELLGALARRIDITYARELRSSLPWSPAQPYVADAGIRGLPAVKGAGNTYEVVLMVPVDAEVRRYFAAREAKLEEFVSRGKAAIGMVSLKLYAGAERVRLSLRAPTTHMSTMLATSPEARKVMTSLARAGQAEALFLDEEDDETWDLLLPLPPGRAWYQRVRRPRWERGEKPGEVDVFCREALLLAGVG
jgi:hypothetical protein